MSKHTLKSTDVYYTYGGHRISVPHSLDVDFSYRYPACCANHFALDYFIFWGEAHDGPRPIHNVYRGLTGPAQPDRL